MLINKIKIKNFKSKSKIKKTVEIVSLIFWNKICISVKQLINVHNFRFNQHICHLETLPSSQSLVHK